jgi:hypothetical protein
MIDQEQERRQDDCEWTEWTRWPLDVRPNDLRQRALAVIATTRYQWASSGSASPAFDEFGFDSKLLVHPLLRRAFDAKRSSGAGARVIRVRPRRRTE